MYWNNDRCFYRIESLLHNASVPLLLLLYLALLTITQQIGGKQSYSLES